MGAPQRLRSKISTLYSTSVAKTKLLDNANNNIGEKNQDAINEKKIRIVETFST
jgi:hypothetical protein